MPDPTPSASLLARLSRWLGRRRTRRELKDILSTLRLAIHMRDDVAPADDLAAARKAEADLLAVLRARRPADLPPDLSERLADTSGADLILETAHAAESAATRLYPPSRFPRLRENIEVLVVAISLALACRTFLIQPFKIPTGSMQPTLNGVLASPALAPAASDRFPANLVKLVLFGKRYVEVRAKASGRVEFVRSPTGGDAFRIGGIIHPVHLSWLPGPRPDPDRSFHFFVEPGAFVQKGDLLASGYLTGGDHVFVNKLAYRFGRPARGDIIVFDTNFIPSPANPSQSVARDTFYIKRLAGLPGESIAIADDHHLLADGVPVTAPYPFRRLLEDPAYDGYALQPASLLRTSADAIPLADDAFLPLGDNTHSSLDGRYFGGVSLRALVGPAFCVYWPLGPHFGRCQ